MQDNEKMFNTIEEVYFRINELEIDTTTKFVTGSASKDFGKNGFFTMNALIAAYVGDENCMESDDQVVSCYSQDDMNHSHMITQINNMFCTGNHCFTEAIQYVLGSISKKKIFWAASTPYLKLGHKILHCQHGKDQHRRRKAKARTAKPGEHCYGKKKRFWVHDSKKLGCPAKIKIQEIFQFPSFTALTDQKWERERVSKQLRTNTDPEKKKMFILTMDEDHTNHPTGKEAESAQPVDKQIINKIHQMVEQGVKDPQEMSRHIKTFVAVITKSNPSASNRRFNPSPKTIKNHMYFASKKNRIVTSDQDNLREFLNEWKEDHPKDLVFVRLKSENEKLLVVIQTDWQQQLLMKYGETVYLDATYCTSKFALPLFFLAVKTNDTYQVVAAFLTEDEASVTIQEALEFIKQHNQTWQPKYFITDLDEKEITAMENLFPEARSLLCDFHRVQAWHRWLSKGTNKVKDKSNTRMLLKNIADELTEEGFQIKVDEFLQSNGIPENVKNYLLRTWLPIKEKWAKCFWDFNLPLSTTNNGLERLHQTFKTSHLRGRKMLSVYQMVQILVTSFFQSLKTSYIESNKAWAGDFKTVNPEVPSFLHKRPPKFIKHCVEKIDLAAQIDRSSAARYVTDVEEHPRCSCPDFRRTCWPCKHIFACLMTEEGNVEWERLPMQYRQSPYLNVDFQVIGDEEQSVTTEQTVRGDTEEYGDNDSQTRKQDCQETLPSVNVLQRKVREQLDLLRDRTFNIEDKPLLKNMETQLTKMYGELPSTSFPTTKPADVGKGKRKSLSLRKRKKTQRNFYEEKHNFDQLPVQKENEETVEEEVVLIEDQAEYQDDEEGDKVRKLWDLPESFNVPVGKVYGNCVTDSDIRSLKSSGWLTDNIIDTYLKILIVELEEAGVGKNLHLVSSTVGQIMNGSYQCRTPYKLTDYNYAVGAYIRASHWTLVVLDFAKEVVYFYNPVGAEDEEMANVKTSMCGFIAKCNNEVECAVRNKWRVCSLPHASQFDSFNCGVYCLIFAEKHLNGQFEEMKLISKKALKDTRLRIAKKMMMFEDCCPKCGMVVEDQDQKLQCALCGRSHHFKPYCVEADVNAVTNGDSFCCTLCRFDYWKWPSVTKHATNNYSWVDKEQALRDLKECETAEDDIEIMEPKVTEMPTDIKRKRRRNIPRNKPKRKRSSFLYPPLAKQRKVAEQLYCICRTSYIESECMWCCDTCDEWFHPKCIGRDDKETPPRAETAFMCEPCLNNHLKDWPVEGAEKALADFDGELYEEGFFIQVDDVERYMRKAFQRCWYLVHAEGQKSGVPWMQRHVFFIKQQGMASLSGFGEALFTQQAIGTLTINLMKRFQRKKDPYSYSIHQVIPSMANNKMKDFFEEEIGQSENCIKQVLLKEAMIVILQEVTGDNYEETNGELQKTEARKQHAADYLILNYMTKERSLYCKTHQKT